MRIVFAFLLLLLLAGTVIILAVMWGKEKPTSSIQTLQIGKNILQVHVADTMREREQGLSGKRSLKENEGMLFVFPSEGTYTFWMKDMRFDLDFIYINNDRVVELIKKVPSPKNNKGEIAIITPQKPFLWVVEVNSGWVKKNKIEINTPVMLY